jgi:para-aminobenzoate synthetase
MRVLLLDNHDSFTYNLYQLACDVFGPDVHVVRNDADPSVLLAGRYDAAIVSPGPGRPQRAADFGLSRDVIDRLDLPTLGVCLGHQGICHQCGGRVVHAPVPMHGRISDIHHDGSRLFAGIPSPFHAVRYHSLACARPLPEALDLTAWTDDGVVMGVAHRSRPLWGVQFHPESISTEHGRTLLDNFRALCAQTPRPARRDAPDAPPAHSWPRSRADGPRRRRTLHVRRRPLELPDDELFDRTFADLPYAFWLDSSTRDPSAGRYSFMGGYGAEDVRALRYSLGEAGLEELRDGRTIARAGDVFERVAADLAGVEVVGPARPFEFAGGFVGYLGYELKDLCGGDAAHRSVHPDAYLLDVDRFLALDRLEGTLWFVYLDREGGPGGAAEAWFDVVEARIASVRRARPEERHARTSDFRPAGSRGRYLSDIGHCLAAIRDGESYEVCLTTRFEATTDADPLRYYRHLRARSPAPYSAFLRFPELAVACSSPERFLKVSRDRQVESKPIKGTLRRGLNAQEDAALRQLLGEDEKSRSENLMIVDLLRNDLGRVCEVGSVTVPRLMQVEAYATVHQLVSTIRGRLRQDRSVVDLVRAAFPGGSMTGAPKKRTMEIIDRLETGARGPYSGAIGFLSLDGAADLNIVIRTAVFSGGTVAIGAGGAIVAMSDPAEEWREVLLKMRGLLAAFGDLGDREPAIRADDGDDAPAAHGA